MIGAKTIKELLQYLRQLFFTKEAMVNVVVCITWVSMLLMFVRAIATRLPGLSDHGELAEAMVVIIPIILSIPMIWKRYTIADFLFYLAWLLLFCFNYIVYPQNADGLEEWAFPCLCCAIPCYFIGRIIDINKYWTIFVWLSGICIVVDMLYYMTFVQSMKSAKEAAEIMSQDNMYASYQLLPHVFMMVWATIRRFNIFTLLLSILGVVMILSFGSRGPMACLGFFCLVHFFCFMNFKYSTYVKVGIVGLCGLAMPFLVEISLALRNFFDDLGLSTRIVDRILRGGLTHDTGRGAIRDKLYYILDNSDNIFGFGLLGSQRFDIIYAHNLFCDVFFSFGYYLGGLLLIALFTLIIWGVIKARGIERQFLLFLFSMSIIKLMVSNTFIADPFLYMLIGYSVYVIRKDKTYLHLYNK